MHKTLAALLLALLSAAAQAGLFLCEAQAPRPELPARAAPGP